jgi:hypothetical protein
VITVAIVKFWGPLTGLKPRQRETVADLLSTIAAEIRKGEHLLCSEHILQVEE